MDILLVISKFLPEYTGAAHRLNKLYHKLPQDFHFSVICGSIEYKNAAHYNHDNIPVNRLLDRSSGTSSKICHVVNFYRDFFETLAAIKTQKFDVMHIVGTSAQTCAALYYAKANNIPAIVELVTKGASPIQRPPVFGKFFRCGPPSRSVLVAISEPLARLCHDLGYGDQCWNRANPVDENQFKPDHENKYTLRKNLFGFGPKDIVLTMIGKFMPQKNQIFLLDVLSVLPEHYKIALGGPLTVQGPLAERDQDYMNTIEEEIRKKNLSDRIFIHKGFISNPQEWMQASDFYVLPNKEEGLATPLIEAQASGLYIVANEAEMAFHDPLKNSKCADLLPLNPTLWAKRIMERNFTEKSDLDERALYISKKYGMATSLRIYEKIFRLLGNKEKQLDLKEIMHESA